MARRRFFVEQVRGGRAELHGDEARHLTRSLRVEAGQRFEISDNQAAYLAEIVEAQGGLVVFEVVEPLAPVLIPLEITLCAALIKFDRFEWIVEKATELGVAQVLPVETARSEKGLLEASRKRTGRWERIARESSQQSRRIRIPEILPAVRFDRVLDTAAQYRYFLDETTASPLRKVLPEGRTPGACVALLIGPEGGWVEAERQAAVSAGWQPASLGPLVLRAETAATAALAILLNAWLV